MKRVTSIVLATTVLLGGVSSAFAQPYPPPDHRYEQRAPEQRGPEQHGPERRYNEVEEHNGWHRGAPVDRGHWEHARPLDYRNYGLREPPPGYEWREVDGAFVLGAIATGVIASILLQPH